MQARKAACRAEVELKEPEAKAEQKAERNVKDTKVGFRWDPSMSRWVQDDRFSGFSAPVEIKPKSGPAYTVRCP